MTTFKQELENLLTNYYVNSHSVTTMHELSIDEKLNKQREVDDEATQAIIELVDREIRKTNISQIENWRDWISTNKELDWLTDEMNEAIEALKDETLTDENGIYLDMKLGLDK